MLFDIRPRRSAISSLNAAIVLTGTGTAVRKCEGHVDDVDDEFQVSELHRVQAGDVDRRERQYGQSPHCYGLVYSRLVSSPRPSRYLCTRQSYSDYSRPILL